MEIDDYRVSLCSLDQLMKDFQLSSEFVSFLNKESFQYHNLIGNIRMEKYLLVRSKCSACLTPQDRRLIYVTEQLTYSDFRDFKRLPTSHNNCQSIDICINNVNESHHMKLGPALTFRMMLALHPNLNIKEQYNLFRYYKIIRNDVLAVESYLADYQELTANDVSHHSEIVSKPEPCEISGSDYVSGTMAFSQFVITHFDKNFDSHALLEQLNRQECFGHRKSKTTVLENLIVFASGSQNVDGGHNDRDGNNIYHQIGYDSNSEKVDDSETIVIERGYQHVILYVDSNSKDFRNENEAYYTRLVRSSLIVNFNESDISPSFIKETISRDEDVATPNSSCKGPNLKAKGFEVWPKWPNIFRNVSKIEHI